MSTDLPIQMFDRPCGNKQGHSYIRGSKKKEPMAIAGARLPVAMLERIDAFAKANYRSRNMEIQFRLEASMANESIDEHGVIVVHSPTPIK